MSSPNMMDYEVSATAGRAHHFNRKSGVLGEVCNNIYFPLMPGEQNNHNNNHGVVMAAKKKKRKKKPRASKVSFMVDIAKVPNEIWIAIFAYCDRESLENLKMACQRFAAIISSTGLDARMWVQETTTRLDQMPSEIILTIFGYLGRRDLGKCAQVCKRFRDLAGAECLWLTEARNCLATNGTMTRSLVNMPTTMSAQDRVRVSRNWVRGCYGETQLIVQDTRYMPRIQLDIDTLWVSWGSQVWAHPRRSDGTVCRTAHRVLRGHSDDVSRFVVKDGLVVSGGRDRTLVGWWCHQSDTAYEFAFARRYCHGSEVSAVDVACYGSMVISGSRDRTVKMWQVPATNNDTISLAHTVNIGDRIWSVAASPNSTSGGWVAVGSAGLCGVPSLHLLDVTTGMPVVPELGAGLRKGAGMLDLAWIDHSNFLSCGYDSYTRMWDIRAGACVRKWEEPFNEAIYCLSTDNNMTLLCGTARHGLVRLWDMRHTQPVQMYYVRHPRCGQSSPVYSLAFDQANLYVALDQCLNLVSFYGHNNHANHMLASRSYHPR